MSYGGTTSTTTLRKESDISDLDFSGKVVFVSGGSRGIGRGIAEAFAAHGADVVLSSRDGAVAEETAAAIAERYGTRCRGVAMDVTAETDVAAAFRTIEAEFGCLDVAVNNAGVANSISFSDLDEAAWDRIIDTNLKGVYTCCRYEVPLMQRHTRADTASAPGKAGASTRTGAGPSGDGAPVAGGAGRGDAPAPGRAPTRAAAIINIASISGSMVNVPQFQSNYNTSKAGVIMLTKSLAVEYAQAGIRFNSISPGYTLTDMNRRPEIQDLIEIWRQRTPAGRLAEVREVADPVLFLASNMASYITGHDLVVDGGITIVC